MNFMKAGAFLRGTFRGEHCTPHQHYPVSGLFIFVHMDPFVLDSFFLLHPLPTHPQLLFNPYDPV